MTEPLTVRRVARSPADVSGLVQFVMLLLVGTALATFADGTMAGIEKDVADFFARLPDHVNFGMLLVTQVLFLGAMIGLPIWLLVTHRRRTAAVAPLAFVLGVVAYWALLRVLPDRNTSLDPGNTEGILVDGWPAATTLTGFSAIAVVLAPELSHRWRRTLWLFVAALTVSRVATAGDVPLDVVLAVALGGVVGCLVLLGLGRPVISASPAAVRLALARAGVAVDSLEPAPFTVPSYAPFLAVGGAGSEAGSEAPAVPNVFVKVRGDQEHEVDSLRRAYRRIRFRDIGDVAAYATPRRAASVDALLTLLCVQRGVRTPRLLAIAEVGDDAVLTAIDYVEGRTLDTVAGDEITDAVLHDLWEQVAAMHDTGVAHRNLELSRLLLDGAGRVWILDFSDGEPAASRGTMAGDVAEALAATYAVVGAARAVAAADAVLGHDRVAEAASRLVPVALTRRTRGAVKKAPDGLAPLVAEVSRVTGVEKVTYAELERVKPRMLLTGVMLAVAVYVLIPQFTGLPRMLEAVREADWAWVPAVVAASVATYLGAGMGIVGGTPGRVSVPISGLVALASTFVSLVTPPGVSHVGLNVRFLQKRGFPPPVAVSASAAKEAAVVVTHLLLVAVFAMWAGRSSALSDEFDSPAVRIGLLVAIGLFVASLAALALRRVRTVVRERVVPVLRSTTTSMAEVVRSPVKMLLLFGGVTLLPLGYAACLYFSVEAFGGGITFPVLALAYLTVGSLASVAPTPGGVGAVEAVLIGSLTALGLASADALAAVFVFRLATFWLPIPLGFVSFRWLTAREVL